MRDVLQISKSVYYNEFGTGVYLLRRLPYGAVTLIFLLTIIQHK